MPIAIKQEYHATMSDFTRAWNAWAAEGLTHEEMCDRASAMQRAAIDLYDTEKVRLEAADPLFAEYYERAWNSIQAGGGLRDWHILPTLTKERQRQLRRDSDYLYELFRKTGGY